MTSEFGEYFYTNALDGERTVLLAGPFCTPEQALRWIKPAKELLMRIDPRAHTYNYGTSRWPDDTEDDSKDGPQQGVFNEALGLKIIRLAP